MRNRIYVTALLALLLPGTVSCGAGTRTNASTESKTTAQPTAFSGDSAYAHTERQTLFGPRVPGSKAHSACKEYLYRALQGYGAATTQQSAELTSWDGQTVHATNLLASFHPEKSKRILLCAHWDSRPWCDQDPDPKKWKTPVEGANDGASGVGVLLEIARQLQQEEKAGRTPKYGVDLVLLDAEDMGTPTFAKVADNEDSWCLGTQYWAKKAKEKNYKAEFGILLDMVGGMNPSFMWDYSSRQYANTYLQKVWSKAAELGYSSSFIASDGGAITDDHVYVNRIAGIPCIDIIDFSPSYPKGFVSTWHTADDTMQHIDRNSLEMVGKVLMAILFEP
jgi:hypothetical protein